jgi:hypothetical protein
MKRNLTTAKKNSLSETWDMVSPVLNKLIKWTDRLLLALALIIIIL